MGPMEAPHQKTSGGFDIRDVETPQLYAALKRMHALLDMRVLPDPLQDSVYLFSMEVEHEVRARPDFEEARQRIDRHGEPR